ncbi:hypothetical protein GOODEAATRI_022835 [Goodea atripinnis]|uniref:Mitoferrin-1 n=1 Tax=Goodea atripinnis TaxID=208336 RepID=A0ABV0N4L2_9TELE
MEVSSDRAVARLEMSQIQSEDGELFNDNSDGDYESLPPHVSVTTHMTAGAVAGILEHTVMYPVDSVKVTPSQRLLGCFCSPATALTLRSRKRDAKCREDVLTGVSCEIFGVPIPDPNAQYKSVYEALKRIIKTEGIFRPLRGLNITMMGAGPAHALYFACYERVKHSLSDIIQSGGNSHIANVVKQRMQMYNSPYRGLWDCVRTVTHTEGIRAFYRSYSTQLTMNIPFQAVHFITYELMQEQLNPHRHYNPGSHIVSGAAAGAVSAAVTTPLDVCKTLLNTQENVALTSVNVSGHLSGMANAFRTVYRVGGLAAFFKGIQARVIYQMPSTAIAWSVYEFFKYFLTKQKLEQEVASGQL